MNTDKSKRKDVNIIIEPGTKKMLAELFGCNEDQALGIVTHIATKKKGGGTDSEFKQNEELR